jgi:ABC-2 type transport system ATP-binding protein
MSAPSVAVSVEGLTKAFGSIRALDGVSLTVGAGEIYGLLGPNGAGKTTLIRSLVGLITVDTGTVTVLGRRLPDRAVLAEIGYMPQSPALYADLTVEENVRFFAAVHGLDRPAAARSTADALEFVDLSPRRRSVVATLSGGMRQRVSLACALVHRPRLLLLDEPTVGVDPQLRAELWRRFTTMSGHVMDEAERCGRLGLVRFGRMLAEGTSAELRRLAGVERLEDAFLVLSESRP